MSSTLLLICCFFPDRWAHIWFQIYSFNVFLTGNQLPFRLQRHMYGELKTPVRGLWEQSSDQSSSPASQQMSRPGWVQMVPASGEERSESHGGLNWTHQDNWPGWWVSAHRQGLFQLGLMLSEGGITTEFTERETHRVTRTLPEVKLLKSDRRAS